MQKTTTLMLAGLGALAGIAVGCNTIKGFGTDVHDVAQNTQMWFEDAVESTTDSRTPSPASPNRNINRLSSASSQ